MCKADEPILRTMPLQCACRVTRKRQVPNNSTCGLLMPDKASQCFGSRTSVVVSTINRISLSVIVAWLLPGCCLWLFFTCAGQRWLTRSTQSESYFNNAAPTKPRGERTSAGLPSIRVPYQRIPSVPVKPLLQEVGESQSPHQTWPRFSRGKVRSKTARGVKTTINALRCRIRAAVATIPARRAIVRMIPQTLLVPAKERTL